MITCIAPVNIAVIKYWGKRNEELILPLNDSISATLNSDFMCAKTSVMLSPNFKENKFWLNGREESFNNSRLQNCLKEIKKRSKKFTLEQTNELKLHICSENNFPTAAGLASSAAGYACLVRALASLYEVSGDLTSIARQGSGSACRSLYGGFVQWHRGELNDGSDSIATKVVPSSHWPELRILILVVNDSKKKVSSTIGMQRSVETSDLLKHRISHVLPQRIKDMIQVINEKNFEKFAEITMRDSNQFHSICLDTYPPAAYLNDTSHVIIQMVHAINEACEHNKVAYSFDAGPNACLFLLEKDVPLICALVNHFFPPINANLKEYQKGINIPKYEIPQEFLKNLNIDIQPQGKLKYIIQTNLGKGAYVIENPNDHLLNKDGSPKHLK